jgi:hypothetical protein
MAGCTSRARNWKRFPEIDGNFVLVEIRLTLA